jgi:hypothetical protein
MVDDEQPASRASSALDGGDSSRRNARTRLCWSRAARWLMSSPPGGRVGTEFSTRPNSSGSSKYYFGRPIRVWSRWWVLMTPKVGNAADAALPPSRAITPAWERMGR